MSDQIIEKTASITDLRDQLANVVTAVRYKNIHVVIEKLNVPVCVLVSYDWYKEHTKCSGG